MAKHWTKKELIELLETRSLQQLEELWREIEKVLSPDQKVSGRGKPLSDAEDY